jgi:hypothetical protein
MPQSMRVVCTVATKLASGSWGHPLAHLLLSRLGFYYARALCGQHLLPFVLIASSPVKSLGAAATTTMEVENMDEGAVTAEL